MVDFDNRPYAVARRTHFWLPLNDRQIGYCYIRKNACTAFKSMVLSESGHDRQAGETDFDFMRRSHAIKRVEGASSADAMILVYRDPVVRCASVFRDKFVGRRGASDILASYEVVTGLSARAATFTTFVHHYLMPFVGHGYEQAIDPHCHSQWRHLWPISYSHAIEMDQLYPAMTSLLGGAKASRYFQAKSNVYSSSDAEENCSDVAAEDLHQSYLENGQLPPHRTFLTPNLQQLIAQIYSRDMALVRTLGTLRTLR